MARIMTLSDDEIETIRIHLSAIKEELCNQSRYGEATYYEKLISTKIICEKINNTIFGAAECEVSDDWTDDDTAQLKEYLSGQYSDGWGEGFEQHEIASYEEDDEFWDDEDEEYYYDTTTYYVYVSFWQYNGFRIMTEDELKEYIGK